MPTRLAMASVCGAVSYVAAKDMFLMRCRALNRSSETIAWYNTLLNQLCVSLGDTGLSDTTSMHLLAHLERIGKTNHPGTVARYYIGLKTFFKVMVDDGMISKNPMAGIPKPKKPKLLIRPLDKTQIAALMAIVKRKDFVGIRNRAMLYLFLDSGLRKSELINLKPEDVDWNGQQVRVMGKGGKERMVPFGNSCRQGLWAYWTKRRTVERQHFFINHFGNKLAAPRVSEMVRRLGARIGVHLTVHQLRHTFATEYIRNGGDPISLKEMLGHETLETVMIYVRLANQDVSLKHRKFSPMDNCGEKRRLF